MMTRDRELWACAHQVIERHGGGADAFVAERITSLARAGDEAGVMAWRAIAERIDLLRGAGAALRQTVH